MNILTEQQKKTLSLGFVGVGWIGKNRMDVLLQSGLATADVIAEPSAANATEALLSSPSAKIANSPEAVFEDPDLDGIVIATPSAHHGSQSFQALLSNKAVFCQKPLGRTASEVKEVVKASQRTNQYLAVDLSYRYTKALSAVHQTVSSGQIGKVYAAELVFHNAYGPDKPWFYDINQSGGGCVMDLGIHLIDMALWCLGFPKIESITSQLYHGGKVLDTPPTEAEDFAVVTMTTEAGAVISINCSWNISAGQDAVIEAKFYGTQGGAAFRNVNGSFYDFKAEKYSGTQTEILFEGPDEWSGRAGVAWADKVLSGQGYDDVSAAELLQTAEAIDRIYGR